jgi:hypothetical protein
VRTPALTLSQALEADLARVEQRRGALLTLLAFLSLGRGAEVAVERCHAGHRDTDERHPGAEGTGHPGAADGVHGGPGHRSKEKRATLNAGSRAAGQAS